MGGGELSCAADCNFDPSACELFEECGDEVASGSEDCDGTDLAGGDCDALGYDGGRLGCNRACTYDFTFCGGFVGCGNNIIDPGEHDE